MDRAKAVEHVYKLAKALDKKGDKMTRADLAYNLESFGFGRDTIELNHIVWEAWQKYDEDQRIRNIFINNDGIGSLVDEYRLHSLVEENEVDQIFGYADNVLKEGKAALEALRSEVNHALSKDVSSEQSSGLISTIMGTSGVEKISNDASRTFSTMTDVKNAYDLAKDEIRDIISVFVELREGVYELFLKYSMLLTDMYGESIKVVAPDLFDFDSIQWLDLNGMYETARLEYDNLSASCSLLMNQIGENFKNSISASITAYRAGEDSITGVSMALLTMLSHYVDSSERTLVLEQELVKFKKLVMKDMTAIKADMFRLQNIYRTINELLVPKANAFYRYSDGVLASGVNGLSELFYADPAIKDIAEDRDRIVDEIKRLEREMRDEEMTVAYYKSAIAQNEGLLKASQQQYAHAKSIRPSKPNVILNLLSFGAMKKTYNRDVYEWNIACAPVISSYESLAADVQLFRQEISCQEGYYEENKKQIQVLRGELNVINKKIASKVKGNESVKAGMVSHLRDILALLGVAKEIMNSGLDEKYLATVKIKDVDFNISPDMEVELTKFTDSMKIIVEKDGAGNYPGELEEQVLIQKTADLMKQWKLTQEIKKMEKKEARHYEQELARMKRNFAEDMKLIDNKGEVLRKTLASINLAMDMEELKMALQMLSENGMQLTDKQIEGLVSGEEIIEI